MTIIFNYIKAFILYTSLILIFTFLIFSFVSIIVFGFHEESSVMGYDFMICFDGCSHFERKSFSAVAEDGNKLKRKFRPWPKR